ncbi:MAG TPA: PfkB family carbohydrate kinase, partial [Stackebrandtia sp.]|uniref:1-phosphofructokinase family hexose kinase n=1 Tax=Stackebrandtia sp. TaxID=2023065 RepID=UPI002D2E468A
MILAVALNAALDVTYHVDGEVRPHATHRVRAVDAMAGGKALNTARVLHGWGEKATATGLVGGATGAQIVARVPAGLPHSFVTVAGESRRALVVADSLDATGFWEPGPEVTAAEWDRFVARFRALLKVSSVAVLSGSLPRGLAPDSYARLVAEARAARVTSILDCDGEALLLALAEKPDLIKPNAAELAAAVPGIDTSTVDGCRRAAERLRSAGAGAVVASR